MPIRKSQASARSVAPPPAQRRQPRIAGRHRRRRHPCGHIEAAAEVPAFGLQAQHEHRAACIDVVELRLQRLQIFELQPVGHCRPAQRDRRDATFDGEMGRLPGRCRVHRASVKAVDLRRALAGLEALQDRRFVALALLRLGNDLGGAQSRHDHDPISVADDQIAGRHRDVADQDRRVQPADRAVVLGRSRGCTARARTRESRSARAARRRARSRR